VAGLALIYSTFPDAGGGAATFFGVGVSFVGTEVATFTVYACVIRLRRDTLQGIFALFGVGLVVGMGPDSFSVGGAPGIDAYDTAGIILWVAGISILFGWPVSLLQGVLHRRYLGA
jgi:hypothetical protein